MNKYDELKDILYKNKQIPYPEIPELENDLCLAGMIYDSYAGNISELTAVTQYVYQHIDVSNCEVLSKILLKISIQEMEHLDILGEILYALGMKPVYICSKGRFWNASNVIYEVDSIEKMLLNNIEAENKSIRAYRDIINYTNNKELKKIFERIIMDEQTHIEIFTLLLKSYTIAN